jgi:hypothetical protein
MGDSRRKPLPGGSVFIRETPPGLFSGLSEDDQRAVFAILNEPIRLNAYDDEGRAELEFTDSQGMIHFLYVSQDLIKTIE